MHFIQVYMIGSSCVARRPTVVKITFLFLWNSSRFGSSSVFQFAIVVCWSTQSPVGLSSRRSDYGVKYKSYQGFDPIIYNFVLSSDCIFYHTFSVLAVETISTILEVRRTRNDFPPTSSSLSIWTVHLKMLFLWIITSSIHIKCFVVNW